LKETQEDLERGRRLLLECEQIYAKVLGADHEETLVLQRARRLLVKKRRMKRGRKIATKEKRRGKRVIAEKDNNTVMTPLKDNNTVMTPLSQ
jgi:hypothetical protein